MLKVKLTTLYGGSWNVLEHTPNSSGIIGDYKFFPDRKVEECDYWVVWGGLLNPETTICPPNHLIFVTAEPSNLLTYDPDFLKQFSMVVTCQREIKHHNVIYLQQGQPWFVYKTYDELKSNLSIQKTKLLSIITSDKLLTEGHRKRYKFAVKLKESLGDVVDVYGRGIRNFDDKWDVLAPYKYSVVIENTLCKDYMTEKLADCFLAETFPFYFGCPNIENYFNLDSLITIDINNIDYSLKVIKETIFDAEHYARHKSSIIRAKHKYLNKHSFFFMIANLLKSSNMNQKAAQPVTLYPQAPLKRSFINRVKSRITSIAIDNIYRYKYSAVLNSKK